jgi:hypothetical protein
MCAFFLALLLAQGGWAKQTFEEQREFDAHIWYGKSIAGLGDVDGDGYGDFAVSAPLANPIGYVEARSGRSGSVIWKAAASRTIGWTLHAAGDVDGDGMGDVVCGLGSGSLVVLSGCNGSQVFQTEPQTLAGDSAVEWNGVADAGVDADLDGIRDLLVDARNQVVGELASSSLQGPAVLCGFDGGPLRFLETTEDLRAGAFVDDLDGDRAPEVLTWIPRPQWNHPQRKLRLRVLSSGAGEELWRTELLTCGHARLAFCRLGDVDGDDIGDLAIGSTCEIAPATHLGGQVWIVSGRTGGVLHSLRAVEGWPLFGYCLAAAGDVDGDEVGDLLIGEYGSWTRSYFLAEGRVHMVSSLSGKTLWTQMDPNPDQSESWEYFGASVASIGDVDGDAIPDVAVGAMNDYQGAFYPGAVHVLSGRDGRWLYSLP